MFGKPLAADSCVQNLLFKAVCGSILSKEFDEKAVIGKLLAADSYIQSCPYQFVGNKQTKEVHEETAIGNRKVCALYIVHYM